MGRASRDLRYYDSWVPHPGTGITPKALFTAFRQAEYGYPQIQVDLFDDLVEGDGTLRNLFEHRERVVANKPLVLTPGDQTADGQTAQRVLTYALGRLPIKAMLEHGLRSNRYGYSGIELDWGLIDIEGRPWIVPVGFALVPHRRFRIGVQGMVPVAGEGVVRLDELRLFRVLEQPQGEPLAPGKWLVLLNAATQIARAGLMRTAAVYAMAKRFSFRDWIVLSEKYGIPMPLVKYKQGADQQTLDTAKLILERLGSDGGAVVSDELELEIVKGIEVDNPMQTALVAFCNAEMSKLINGSTLRNDTKDSSGASYALGNIHDQVAWDEVRRDGSMVSEAVTLQICAPFVRFNGLTCEAPTAMLMVEPDLGPVEMTSLMVKGKNELGVDVSTTQWRQHTGVREPLNDADKAPGMVVQAFPTPAGGPP